MHTVTETTEMAGSVNQRVFFPCHPCWSERREQRRAVMWVWPAGAPASTSYCLEHAPDDMARHLTRWQRIRRWWTRRRASQ